MFISGRQIALVACLGLEVYCTCAVGAAKRPAVVLQRTTLTRAAVRSSRYTSAVGRRRGLHLPFLGQVAFTLVGVAEWLEAELLGEVLLLDLLGECLWAANYWDGISLTRVQMPSFRPKAVVESAHRPLRPVPLCGPLQVVARVI